MSEQRGTGRFWIIAGSLLAVPGAIWATLAIWTEYGPSAPNRPPLHDDRPAQVAEAAPPQHEPQGATADRPRTEPAAPETDEPAAIERRTAPAAEAEPEAAPPVEPPARMQAGPRPLADILYFEEMTAPDKSDVSFPAGHLRQRLAEALAGATTTLPRLRFAVAFVEPRELRARAVQGAIIGYIVAALPDVPGCRRQFGETRAYEFTTPQLGMMKAINEQAPAIADWLRGAVQGGNLACP